MLLSLTTRVAIGVKLDRNGSDNRLLPFDILETIRLKELPRFEGPIRSATFSRKAARWFVSLQIDTIISPKSPSKEAVGVDLGINTLAHTSDGVSFLSPKPLTKRLRALKRASRKLSKKENGSKAWGKQKLKVQKIHLKIANTRKDTLHNSARYRQV